MDRGDPVRSPPAPQTSYCAGSARSRSPLTCAAPATSYRYVLDSTPAAAVEQRDLYDRWPEFFRSWADDSTVLVGDAVHPMMPNLGQGGGMAIEDALVLGQERPHPNPNPNPNPDPHPYPNPNPNFNLNPKPNPDPSPSPNPNPNPKPKPNPNSNQAYHERIVRDGRGLAELLAESPRSGLGLGLWLGLGLG